MDIFLTVLKYAGGPLLGALIGYFTNWLAVKMLFRPYYPKKLGKWKLPFTPGIIPKRRPALAKAVGEAVGGKLFTGDDLISAISSDTAKDKFADYALSLWHGAGQKTADGVLSDILDGEQSDRLRENAADMLGLKIYDAVTDMDLGGTVAREGKKVIIAKKSSLGMLAMFVSDDLISSLMEKLADGVNAYIGQNGRRLITEAVKNELDKSLSAPLYPLTERIGDETVKRVASRLYDCAAADIAKVLSDSIDISAVVEEKINAMDVKELEKLVLSVMKKELNAIVNLGALIGFILGIIMIFI